MYVGLPIKYLLFLSGFNKFESSRQISEKSSNINYHENRLVRDEFFQTGRDTW